MKIKELYIESYGPYSHWSFQPHASGVHVIYGPNESGKTSLLRAFRSILLGRGRKEEPIHGHMIVERDGHDYYIGREDKKLTFYQVGGETYQVEPSELWWQGLSKKTFDRVFAITLEDMQGVDILHEVDVRARFFGAEGGDALGKAVTQIDRMASDLLVASASGKRTINTLLERLRQDDELLHGLRQGEAQYATWRQRLDQLVIEETELLEKKRERKEYLASVELVLRGWDTYKRAEEARLKMQQIHYVEGLERETFLQIDEEIRQCQEYMRIWRGKEEGLVPDQFDPEDQLGIYGREIESLYEEISKWSQLEKECEEGDAYLEKVRAQLAFVRRSHTYWQPVETLPDSVNWYEGERRARQLGSAREAYTVWQQREPFPQDESSQDVLKQVELLEEREKELLRLQALGAAVTRGESLSPQVSSGRGYTIGAIVVILLGLGAFFLAPWWVNQVLLGLACLIGAVLAYQGYRRRNEESSTIETSPEEETYRQLQDRLEVHSDEELRHALESVRLELQNYAEDRAHYQAYENVKAAWLAEGRDLEAKGSIAMDAWQEWLPEEARVLNRDEDFYPMKEEYDAYMVRLREYEGYEKQMATHREQLDAIVQRAQELWKRLQIEGMPSIVELRKVYHRLQQHKQHRVRWEQKEVQRKNYRDEYMQWSKKEKELLLQQDEVVKRVGLTTAAEYRQQLLQQEQYKQWETIYRQSQVQLDLLAPKGSHSDLLYRRLKGNDKTKWEMEYARNEEALQGIETDLAQLYEERGTLQESIRHMASSHDVTVALQRREQDETELREALEDWITYVLIHEGMQEAQAAYEQDRQPAMLARSSAYLKAMTGGIYALHIDGEASQVYVKDTTGRQIPLDKWSSGLGDQVYLALRLSMAASYGEMVDTLPLVLDDVLVRFDVQRQDMTLDVLESIGRDRQVFLFTCHEPTFQLRQEGVHAYRLREGRLEVMDRLETKGL